MATGLFKLCPIILIVKGVKVYPEPIRKAVITFRPKATGFLRILIDRPGPLVVPPLKIRIEYGEKLQRWLCRN